MKRWPSQRFTKYRKSYDLRVKLRLPYVHVYERFTKRVADVAVRLTIYAVFHVFCNSPALKIHKFGLAHWIGHLLVDERSEMSVENASWTTTLVLLEVD